MTTWYAQNSSVNIDSVNQWNDAAGGGGNWLTWASLAAGDVLMWNGKTNIAINVNVTCASLRNTNFGGATAGGTGTISDGVVITADLYSSTMNFLTLAGTASATIIGDLSGESVFFTVTVTTSGVLTIVGDLVTTGALATGRILQQSAGTIHLTGNVHNLSISVNFYCISKTGGILNITGNASGGVGATTPAVQQSGGTTNVTGDVTGGAGCEGISLIAPVAGTTVKVIGHCYAGTYPAIGSQINPANAKVILHGDSVASAGGTAGVSVPCVLIHSSMTLTHTYRVDNSGSAGVARSLYTGGVTLGFPDADDVRESTTYGASGEYTGTLAVPDPQYVAFGVDTDNTVGTYEPDVDLTPVLNRLPAALVGGRMASHIEAIDTAAFTAAVLTRFVTVDTGETEATEGSVAQLSQGTEVDLSAVTDLIGTPVVSVSADIASMQTDVDGVLGYLVGLVAKFTGMTSLPDWLRRFARKDAGSAGMVAAETEINTGGTATFAGATDSLEGNRDKTLSLKGSLNETQAFDLLLAAAAGETSQTDDTETFKFLDGDDAFVTTFDEDGNRVTVELQ